jgi:hypothetical protein
MKVVRNDGNDGHKAWSDVLFRCRKKSPIIEKRKANGIAPDSFQIPDIPELAFTR